MADRQTRHSSEGHPYERKACSWAKSAHEMGGNMRKTSWMLVLALFIQCFSIHPASAASNVVEKPIEGTVSKIAYLQESGNKGTVTIQAAGAAIANRELWSPDATHAYYRLIVDLKNTKIGNPGTLVVNKGSVLQVRFSQFDATRSRFVLDISEKPTYTVSASDSKVDIFLNGSVTSASMSSTEGADIQSPKPSASTAPTPKATAVPTPKATAVPTPKATVVPTPKASVGASPASPSVQSPAAEASGMNPVPNLTPVGMTGTNLGNTINSAAKGPLSWSMLGDTCVFKLDGIDLTAMVSQGTAVVENRIREKMIQITIKSLDSRFVTGAMSGNSILHGALVSMNSLRQTTTIRLSGKSSLAYVMENSASGTLMRIRSNGSTIAGNGSTAGTGGTTTGLAGSSSAGSTSLGSTSSGSTGAGSSGLNGAVLVGDNLVDRGGARTLPLQFSANTDTVTITSTDVSGSRVYRYGRNIQIEVPGVAVPAVISVGSPLIREAAGVSADGRTKVTVTTGVFSDWTVTETAGKLEIRFVPVDVVNLEGGNDGDTVLRLTGEGIVAKYRTAVENNQIVIDDDFAMSAFTFMFPTSVINLGNGIAKTNDTLSTGISTLMTGQNSFLSIAKRSGATQFRLVEEADGNALTIRKSVAEAPVYVPNGAARLVMLDPGHGGTDPGAVFEGIYESTVNLDIALRVEAILKQQNINVSMTRRTDAFVGLEDRCTIANNAGASLFVSIHQNSMPDPATKGTMTLYYASSVNGKKYADILQQTLAPAVGLGSIGLKSSSGLVVLRKTKMPAILAEVACMSNVEDMQVIKTDAYRQNAAQGIANGILRILATMN